jgi:hypothetical protein
MTLIKGFDARVISIHIRGLIFLSSMNVFVYSRPTISSQETLLAQRSICALIAQKSNLKTLHDRLSAVHRNKLIAPVWFVVQDSSSVSGQNAIPQGRTYTGRAIYVRLERAPPFSPTLL